MKLNGWNFKANRRRLRRDNFRHFWNGSIAQGSMLRWLDKKALINVDNFTETTTTLFQMYISRPSSYDGWMGIIALNRIQPTCRSLGSTDGCSNVLNCARRRKRRRSEIRVSCFERWSSSAPFGLFNAFLELFLSLHWVNNLSTQVLDTPKRASTMMTTTTKI